MSNPAKAANLPGISFLRISKVIHDFATGKISIDNALQVLVAHSLQYSPNGDLSEKEKEAVQEKLKTLQVKTPDNYALLKSLLDQELVELKSKIKIENTRAKEASQNRSPYAYLLDYDLQRSVVGLASYLVSNEWALPKSETHLGICDEWLAELNVHVHK